MSHKLRRLTTVAYAVNGSGLGHLTRVVAILRWMRRLARLSGVQLEAYVLTSSEAPGLALEESFATFKIPSKTAVRKAGLPKDDYLRLARQWVWHSVGLLKPDLLLVDTFPGGSFGELLHTLDVPRARVFIRRAMKEEFARLPGVRNLLPLYDKILVPGELDATTTLTTDAVLASKTRHTGPILLRSREELRPREEARRRLGVPADKLGVWLSAGGGGDPRARSGIETLVETLRREPDLHLVVGAGPLCDAPPLRGPNITWLSDFNAMRDFAGLDFAFSAAGYNSFHELLHAGVPAAFFAQEKIADEQSRRVSAASAAGCALSIEVDGDGAPRVDEIVRALEEFRDAGRRAEIASRAREVVPLNSAREAAYEVLATVLPRDVLDEAFELGSPQLFLTLDARGVEPEEVERVNRRLKSVADFDEEERGDFILRLISRPDVSGKLAARLFHILAQRVPVLTSEGEAEELLDAALLITAAASFAGERALLELARALPADERLRPGHLAAGLCRFLEALDSCGDSVSRGRSVLARHLGNDASRRPLADALAAASDEIMNCRQPPVDLQPNTLAGDRPSHGD